jgi:5-methylcytosine-specific restriction protein A
MPNEPRRRCTAPGCPNLGTPAGRGRCERCRRHHKSQRTTWTDMYGPEWPTIRLGYLERHPRCALCPRQASTPDHYPVGIRELRARQVTNPHHDRYLRPLCHVCHSKHTARAQPSGFTQLRK